MSHNNYNLGDDSEGTFSSQAHTFNLPPRINTASAQLGPASARGGDVLSDVSEDSGWSDLCKGSAATLYLSRTDGSEQARVVKKLMRVDPQYFENNGDGRDKRELLDNLREEFDAKFSSWSLLQDHRIASVFSVDSRTLTFHQDFYPRGDLRQFCQQGLSGTMCRGVFRDILAGVLYLHTQMPPIVHGCINPGKIYMTYDNRAKIGEFSLSQLAQNFSHLTPSVSVDWMLRWMSPEYVNNESIPTTQSDVWSLGCTFFEVITGCLPYHKHKSHVRILELLLSGVDPNLNEDIPTVISVIDLRTAQLAWQLIKKCWRPTEERPVAKQLLQELDSLLNNSRPLGPASLETKLVSAVEGPSLRGGCDKIISPRMMVDEVLRQLHSHGCKSMSPYVNRSMSGDNPVACGGFGDIYRGVLNNGAEVSLKCVRLEVNLDDGGQRKIKDAAHELYIWSKCKHPNVLELMGVTEHYGYLAMVSPWMENGDLTQFLAEHPDVDRYNLCGQIADGVAYLHQENVAHGDIRGVNVLISKDHTPKITGFVAHRIDRTSKFTETSGSQTMSIRWMAPEVIGDITEKSTPEGDIFSLGSTILEVFTGNVPFPGVSTPTVIMKLLAGGHPARPEEHIPTGDDRADLLWSLLSDCWAFKPEDRPTVDNIKCRMRIIGSM